MLLRLGQHRGLTTKAFEKVAPSATSSRRTSGMAHRVSHRWSSVRIRTMLGRPPEAAGERPRVSRSTPVVTATRTIAEATASTRVDGFMSGGHEDAHRGTSPSDRATIRTTRDVVCPQGRAIPGGGGSHMWCSRVSRAAWAAVVEGFPARFDSWNVSVSMSYYSSSPVEYTAYSSWVDRTA